MEKQRNKFGWIQPAKEMDEVSPKMTSAGRTDFAGIYCSYIQRWKCWSRVILDLDFAQCAGGCKVGNSGEKKCLPWTLEKHCDDRMVSRGLTQAAR